MKIWLLFAISTIISTLGTVTIPSDSLNAQNSPRNPQSFQRVKLLLPFLIPDGATSYVVLKPGTKITGLYGLPAAQFATPPADVASEIATWAIDSVPKDRNGKPIPPEPEPSPNAIRYQMISSTRYRGNGKTIFVTTARMLNPNGVSVRHTLGSSTAQLRDGTPMGVLVACNSLPNEPLAVRNSRERNVPKYLGCIENSKTPNQVVFVKDGLIVSIASDLPIDRVTSLAENIILK